MDRRRNPRVAAELSVRVWGVDSFAQPFAQVARVKNISKGGMVIQGIARPVKAGEVLEVQLDGEKAQFRVAWAGKAGGRRAGEVGLARLSSLPDLLELNSAFFVQGAGRS